MIVIFILYEGVQVVVGEVLWMPHDGLHDGVGLGHNVV